MEAEMKVETAPAVSVRNLEKRFGDFIAVNRVSFEVARGEVFGFLGPNGAGKSTTIRMLCGILARSGGEGTVAGCKILYQQERIKMRIGYMSQKFSLYEDLTVRENLDFYAGIYDIPGEKSRLRKTWVMEMTDLGGRLNDLTGSLPVGWKQRLALGCAVLHEPDIVFLDEPTSGVDPVSRRRFWDLIYDLSDAGITVFVTTHYMDEAEYCGRLALIYRGEIIAAGSPERLKKDFMSDRILEVQTERFNAAMDVLDKVPGVKESALFGNGLHIVVENAGAAIPRIQQALREAAVPIGEIRRIEPSLEDVFVSLIESRDRAASMETPA